MSSAFRHLSPTKGRLDWRLKPPDATDAQLKNDCQGTQISKVVGTSGVEVLHYVVLRPQGRSRAVPTGTRLLTPRKTWRTPAWKTQDFQVQRSLKNGTSGPETL